MSSDNMALLYKAAAQLGITGNAADVESRLRGLGLTSIRHLSWEQITHYLANAMRPATAPALVAAPVCVR